MVIDCFAEDVDYPNGITPIVDTNAAHFRAMSRCALVTTQVGGYIQSSVFSTGIIQSGWLSAWLFIQNSGADTANRPAIGFAASGTVSGLFISVYQNTIRLLSMANGVVTTLAVASSVTIANGLSKIDLQVSNYGAAGTLTAYVNGVQAVTYTGNLAIAGVAGFDSVFIGAAHGDTGFAWYVSEVVVADESTLGCQGVDLREITGNGTVQQFNNPAYTNFNPTVINDANSTYSNTAGQDEQATLANSVAGNFAIKAVKIVARANAPAGSAITNLKLGFSNGAGVVGVGAAHALGVGFAPVADILTTDPTTGQPFTSIDGYQIDLRSA